MKNLTVDFFLGANTEKGFVSHFEQMQDPRLGYHTYIIKGTPGSGKSTLMKHIADHFESDAGLCERIRCSSDPDSLDGVILHNQSVNVVDGTPPHVVEPHHPVALESIVSLYDAFHPTALQNKTDQIVETTARNAALHKRFCSLLQCANLLLDGNISIIAPYIDYQKMEKTILNIVKREMKKNSKGSGTSHMRLISAFTPKGLFTYESTVSTLCEKIYLLNDEYNACSDCFIRLMERLALEKGYECYVCLSPFHAEGKADHLFIPELSLGFVTKNHFISFDQLDPYRVINATRFYSKEIIKAKKQRLRFCRKTATELITEGLDNIRLAKQVHDQLEGYYVGAIDFDVIQRIEQRITDQIHAYALVNTA